MARAAQRAAMRAEVDVTLAELELPPEHRAAGALARLYADQLDSAEAAERAADGALTAALKLGADAETAELIQSLRSKLSARQTVVNIGPRLAELLGRLLATPKDSGASSKPRTPAATKPGSLALLRGGQTG
jgi:hypothetical protein